MALLIMTQEKPTTNKNNKDSIFSLIKSPYIRHFFKKYWLRYLIGIFFLLTIDIAQTKIPIIIGEVIDGLELGSISFTAQILPYIVKVGILAVAIVLGRATWRHFIFGTSRYVERDIRNDLFKHMQKLSLSYYHNHKTGEMMAYITNDLEAVRQAMGSGVMMIFDCTCLLVFILYNMLTKVSISLTVVAVIPLILIACVTGMLGPKLFKRFDQRQEAFARISDFVQEDMSGIKVIKAFVQQDKEVDAFKQVNQHYFSTNMSLMRLRACMNPMVMLISGFSFAIAIGYGGYLTLGNGSMSLGLFNAFILYLGMLVWPMMAVGMSINTVTMGSASLRRIESVLNQVPDIVDCEDAVDIELPNWDIRVDNLTYKYPNTNAVVLDNISFEVKQGQTLGIVGRTGSGKTTLVNLLVRLYDVAPNTMFIGGQDILKMPLKTLRGNIGYVPQDNFLFSDSIRNNIDFVDGNLPLDSVRDATEFSCVTENVDEFRDGYNTIIGEKGVTLSGGQKQRVSISRAYINNPQILILDDSVSAVDTDTEEQILANIKSKRSGKTNIIIAHRLSALQDADIIIVIDEGKLIEQGTHQQLLANDGLYCSLYNKQQLQKMIDEQ